MRIIADLHLLKLLRQPCKLQLIRSFLLSPLKLHGCPKVFCSMHHRVLLINLIFAGLDFLQSSKQSFVFDLSLQLDHPVIALRRLPVLVDVAIRREWACLGLSVADFFVLPSTRRTRTIAKAEPVADVWTSEIHCVDAFVNDRVAYVGQA